MLEQRGVCLFQLALEGFDLVLQLPHGFVVSLGGFVMRTWISCTNSWLFFTINSELSFSSPFRRSTYTFSRKNTGSRSYTILPLLSFRSSTSPKSMSFWLSSLLIYPSASLSFSSRYSFSSESSWLRSTSWVISSSGPGLPYLSLSRISNSLGADKRFGLSASCDALSSSYWHSEMASAGPRCTSDITDALHSLAIRSGML